MHTTSKKSTRPNSKVASPMPKGREKTIERIVAIGDIHGRDTWKKIVEQETKATKVVFVGDYFDSFGIPGDEQIKNFKEILDYKRENIHEVVLILGNHDFHYIQDGERYSGYQDVFASQIRSILDGAIREGLVQMCYYKDGYLFSHAGVTETWASQNEVDTTPIQIEHSINQLLHVDPAAFSYNRLDRSGTGEASFQSPIWVRPDGLIPDVVEPFTQVVGHTQMKGVQYYNGKSPAKVIMIDALEDEEFLIINDDKVETGHVEA